jgi:hypothetical protein
MGSTNPPPPAPQSSKARSIEIFGKNISQLSLCVNVSHLDISLLHMISQEVVSHFEMFHSFMEDWVFGYRDSTGVVTNEENSLKDHSKVSHGVHNPWDLGAVATYSASLFRLPRFKIKHLQSKGLR